VAGGFELERGGAEGKGDSALLAAFVLLAGTGLAALWSASAGYAISLGRAPWWFAFRQAVFLLPAGLAFGFLYALPLDRLRALVGPLTVGCLLSLLLPFMPLIGDSRNGASRWIDIGIGTIQPSEFWKPVVILYLAHVLDRRGPRLREGTGPLVAPFLLASLGVFFIILQNDFSTAMIAAFAAAAAFWAAGAPLSFFAGLAAVGAPLAALVVLTSDFRLRRILSFLYPAYEPHGQGYQVLGSLRAIGEGGFLGKGFGLGELKLRSLPAVQSDFIVAAWAEETGFLGVLALLGLWAFIAWRVYRRAFAEADGFRSALGFCLVSLLLVQVLVNVAVAGGAIPATGIALPFFSAGGSSLIASAGVAGVLSNLARGERGHG
jgi:cell division protein FtsW